MFSKNREGRGSNMLKTWTSEKCKRLALINSKPEPKKERQLALTCSKSGPGMEKEESALTCLKPELKGRKGSDSNMLKT